MTRLEHVPRPRHVLAPRRSWPDALLRALGQLLSLMETPLPLEVGRAKKPIGKPLRPHVPSVQWPRLERRGVRAKIVASQVLLYCACERKGGATLRRLEACTYSRSIAASLWSQDEHVIPGFDKGFGLVRPTQA